MNHVHFFIRFLIRNLKWFIIGLFTVGVLSILFTRNMSRTYEVSSTVYTGFTSGFNIESGEGASADYLAAANATDNLINIVKSRSTLERVALKLFAQSLIYGNEAQDNKYITAKSYRELLDIVPEDIRFMVNKQSVDSTVNKFQEILHSDRSNFIYELLNWYHKHYSIKALSNINVYRVNSSDMLEIRYQCNDPALCYQTIILLNEEFAEKYKELRFSETNDVVAYFEAELIKAQDTLVNAENRLMEYNKANRIINYEEQTKSIASLFEKFELQYQQIQLQQSGAEVATSDLESKLEGRKKLLQENSRLVAQLKKVQDLTTTMNRVETFQSDSLKKEDFLDNIKQERHLSEVTLKDIAERVDDYHSSKEGIIPEDVLQQWLFEVISSEKAKSQRNVLDTIRGQMDSLFTFYSPIGANLTRMEREINVAEQSYLSLLHSLSLAKLKQKNLLLTSASLRTVTEPIFPLDSKPTKRKIIVILSLVAAMFFIAAYLLLIEFFDSTLRDPVRTYKLTKTKVLGVIPDLTPALLKDNYEKIFNATAHLATNNVLEQTRACMPCVVNVFSNQLQEGKSFFCEMLQNELEKRHYKVVYLKNRIDFDITNRQYDMAEKPEDLLQKPLDTPVDFYIIDYPIVTKNNIPGGMLKNGHLNVMVCDARRGWAEADQSALERLKEQATKPLFIYLNHTKQAILEEYVGLLPPYTRYRKLLYKIYNLELSNLK